MKKLLLSCCMFLTFLGTNFAEGENTDLVYFKKINPEILISIENVKPQTDYFIRNEKGKIVKCGKIKKDKKTINLKISLLKEGIYTLDVMGFKTSFIIK
ncbi:MAG TPA: hypothetical protein VLZ83_09625 [Edaphocola sp.]|nr:hypothetical protein [Edaphocola sp.]